MRIAVLPGDGIGPEVIAPALETLPDADLVTIEAGAERYLATGEPSGTQLFVKYDMTLAEVAQTVGGRLVGAATRGPPPSGSCRSLRSSSTPWRSRRRASAWTRRRASSSSTSPRRARFTGGAG